MINENDRLRLTLRTVGDVCVVDVRGDVDLETGPRLKEAIGQATSTSGARHVALNMTGAGYLDSSGLGILLGARKRLQPRSLHLFGFNEHIGRIIALTGLNKLFDIHATEAEALAHAATETNLPRSFEAGATLVPVVTPAATNAATTVAATQPASATRGEMAGRAVIVTGGGGGVGQTVVRRWLRAGAHVLAVDRPGSPALAGLRGAAANEPDAADRLATFGADVATEAGASALVEHAAHVFGRPADTLLHLVGGFAQGPLDAADAPDNWRKMMALNLDSVFFCYRAMLPGLRARGGGWIVGLGSRAAVSPPAHLGAYAASKAGLIALTQSLSAEVKADNIHVNVVLASTIDTPANRNAMGGGGDVAAATWVTPDDIAEATFYLCSPERGRAIHGASLEVYASA